MFAAAAAAASGGQRSAGRPSFPPPSLFGNNKRPSGLESPPASLDNRSTPGSLDLSRSKEDYLGDFNDEMPPTMVKMEAMVYPKMDSEEDEEVQTRLEKRVFQDSDDDSAQDLSASSAALKKPKLELENEQKPGDNNNDNESSKLDDLRVKDEFKETKEESQ